ncbi:endopeptidase La [Malonomonas rubra]|uniref:endopeptidase La n=1 Tax=Malonomonas rubra TaxID=57040 RepID=UPI000934931D
METQSYTLPVLPITNSVIYPGLAMPMTIHRTSSVKSLEAVFESGNKMIAVFAQRSEAADPLQPKDLFEVGTAANVQLISRFGSSLQVILHGVERIEIVNFIQFHPFLKAQVSPRPISITHGIETEALHRETLELVKRYFDLSRPEDSFSFPRSIPYEEDIMKLVFPMSKLMSLSVENEQQLLAAPSDKDAMKLLNGFLNHEIQILEVRQKISEQTKDKLNQEHRKYILREQIKTLQHELGEGDPEIGAQELRRKFEETPLPEEIKNDVEKELARFEQIPQASPEYQVAQSHLELILALPWEESTTDNLDLANARQVLDEDHYDLREVKERIIEQLAVMKLNPEAKAPILCFAGPPGVGKTSLGQSIARALGRKFDRFSLGGMHDEAELRGHRRTYIGAMPGRVLQAVRRAGVKNPLIMLDEIDKLGHDFRGDPAAALMEILDPAQNNSFHDNYLDLPFDLSKVFFITTANSIDTIPKPLLDRMELLYLSGYSDLEKMEIARRYLLPRQRTEAGLSQEQIGIPDDTLNSVIRRYTREAGVRELERMLGRLARKVAVSFAEGKNKPYKIQVGDLRELLGPERFFVERLRKDFPSGVATGLAWTEAGGDVLYIEAIALPEGDPLTMTGHLGEVMKESAMASNSYVIAHCHNLGISKEVSAVHLHVPAGATPKDGPSAGVTMATALASLYSNHPVRRDTAMTGEITLSGLVLPVGGVKEKMLAAHRAGLRRVILPNENKKDLEDLPAEVRSEMEFIFVDRIEEALEAAIPNLLSENNR